MGRWRTPVIDGSQLPFGYALSVSLRLTAPPKGGAEKNCCAGKRFPPYVAKLFPLAVNNFFVLSNLYALSTCFPL